MICRRCRRRWYFFVTLFGTIPVYGTISNIPAFRHSLTDVDKWGAPMWILIVSGAFRPAACLLQIGAQQGLWRRLI